MFVRASLLLLFAFTAVQSGSEFLKEFRRYFPADLANIAADEVSNNASEGNPPFLVSYRIGLAYRYDEMRYYFIQHGPAEQVSAIVPADIIFDEASSEIHISSPNDSYVLPLMQLAVDGEEPQPYRLDSVDFEPAALEWNGIEKRFFWVNSARPQVVLSSPSGEFQYELPILDYHQAQYENDKQVRGIPEGRGYNAAAMTCAEGKGCRMDVIPVAPLVQDSAAPSVKNPEAVPVRITQYNYNPNEDREARPKPVSEFVYMMGPLPKGFDEIVVEDVVSLGQDEALVLETYTDNSNPDDLRFMSQVFRIQYNPARKAFQPEKPATNVINQEIANRVGVDVFPVKKELVYRIDDALLGDDGMVDRLSYMVFGPDLKEGRLLLIGSDSENLPSPRAIQLLAFRWVDEASIRSRHFL